MDTKINKMTGNGSHRMIILGLGNIEHIPQVKGHHK